MATVWWQYVDPSSLFPGSSIFFFNLFYFIYLFLAALVLRCCAQLSLVAASRGYSLLQCAGLPLRWLLLLQSMGSRHMGFSSCGTGAL